MTIELIFAVSQCFFRRFGEVVVFELVGFLLVNLPADGALWRELVDYRLRAIVFVAGSYLKAYPCAFGEAKIAGLDGALEGVCFFSQDHNPCICRGYGLAMAGSIGANQLVRSTCHRPQRWAMEVSCREETARVTS